MHSHFHVKPNLEHFEQLLISKLMLTKPSLAEVGTMAELGNIVATLKLFGCDRCVGQ